jgi:hypothetical protein
LNVNNNNLRPARKGDRLLEYRDTDVTTPRFVRELQNNENVMCNWWWPGVLQCSGLTENPGSIFLDKDGQTIWPTEDLPANTRIEHFSCRLPPYYPIASLPGAGKPSLVRIIDLKISNVSRPKWISSTLPRTRTSPPIDRTTQEFRSCVWQPTEYRFPADNSETDPTSTALSNEKHGRQMGNVLLSTHPVVSSKPPIDCAETGSKMALGLSMTAGSITCADSIGDILAPLRDDLVAKKP